VSFGFLTNKGFQMSVTKETTHAAKKIHRCTWCWQLIEVGSEYKRYRYFNCGDAGTCKMHPECFDAMQEAAREEGGFFAFTPGQERPLAS